MSGDLNLIKIVTCSKKFLQFVFFKNFLSRRNRKTKVQNFSKFMMEKYMDSKINVNLISLWTFLELRRDEERKIKILGHYLHFEVAVGRHPS